MSAFARAAARFLEFRQSSQITSETRVLSCRCARGGEHYAVVFERRDGEKLFTVAQITKELAGAPGKARRSRRFNAGEFDFSDVRCPWCGDEDQTVHCGECGELVCGGRVRRTARGKELFGCYPACGSEGRLKSARHVPASGGMRRQTALASRPQRQLVSNAGALLTGPRK